ncbi:flagellar hook-length control protein FliK, partial [Phenylobacterium sp. CCH12-B4]|uniref:flagellar hook-length control protein FliK n=2 Tax=unclassified Phenylobacterium TaxID=2640670 RepID=UPI000AD88CA2
VEAVETPATAAANLSARPEAAAAAAPLRPAKAERVKSADAPSAETPDELKPSEAADKPVHAKAAQGAAKAAAASAEAAETKPQDADTSAESPDATGQGETRAASPASSSAAAQAGHVVRGSPETVANLAAQIVKKLEGKSTRFDVELDPHGLGKVDVRIEIGAQGRITAGMTFENPQAAADVKARAAELQRVLEQAGFDVSGGISFDVAGDRGHPQQQNQAWQDQGDAGRAFQGRAFRAALETAGDAADAANQGALRLRRGVNSGLDLRI